MRMMVSWDGSGHALRALRDMVGLFRAGSVEHVEILITVWPPRDIAMWSDIQQRQFISDDLHAAAAQVATENLHLLEDILRPISQSIASSTTNGPFEKIIAATIARTNADLLFVIAGTHDRNNAIAESMRTVVAESKIPTWILRPPGTEP
jgi:hypothetical protein